MKIIVDKAEGYPPHALSRADVRVIFSCVPPAWAELVKVVRLSASRSATSPVTYASFGETLTIASRGQTKDNALHHILTELAAHALGFKQRTFQALQARHKAEVQRAVEQLVDEVWPQIR